MRAASISSRASPRSSSRTRVHEIVRADLGPGFMGATPEFPRVTRTEGRWETARRRSAYPPVDGPPRSVTLPRVRLSFQVQYAICGVFDLAYNGHGEPVQVRVISERQGVPARYLEQIFGRLRRAGIVLSKRGPGGGYTLARAAATITLRQVVEAVAGPLEEGLAMEDQSDASLRLRRPDFVWPALASRIGEVLDATHFEHLCLEAARAEIPRVEAEAPMYFI